MEIEVYTKDNCGYCVSAKTLLEIRGLEFKELKLDRDFTREDFLTKFEGWRTFPAIVIDGEFIGGYDKLEDRI